jgi:acetyl esterase/lipase
MLHDENILTPYILTETEKKGTVLICPGGGYEHISPREGKPVALAFNERGYDAFVLEYTVVEKTNEQSNPLQTKPLADLAWAIAYIRENASQYKIDPDKIAVCGFSAGGHLAGNLGVHWHNPNFWSGDKPDAMYKPNALILCYPVISAGEHRHAGSIANLVGEGDVAPFSLENHVSAKTPPTFLWHTAEDTAVPVQNSLAFAGRLAKHRVPFELHIYPFGGHGLSLATAKLNKGFESRHVGGWIDLCAEWLEVIL